MTRTPQRLSLLILALACAGARAQYSQSHVELPWDQSNARDLALQLQGRLRQPAPSPMPNVSPEMAKRLAELLNGKDQSEWQKLLKDNPSLAEAARGLNQQNPAQLKDLVEKMRSADQSGNTFQGQRWEDFLREIGRSAASGTPGSEPKPPIGPGPVSPPPLPPPGQPRTPENANLPAPGVPPGAPDFQPPPDLPRQRGQASSDTSRALERWLPKSLRDSPAMKSFFRDMGRRDWSGLANAKFWKEGKVGNINWSKFGNRLSGTGRFMQRNMPSLSGRHVPSAPNVRTPNMPRGPNMPNVGAPSASGGLEAGRMMSAVMVLAALALGGFLLWRLILQPLRLARDRNTHPGLGPWPVDPARIRTRDELVKAFDYLTLLLLGLPARMWHFRTVASRLGEAGPKRRAADSLAEAYMQARYAPPAEPLPEPQMQQASRDICALAGVGAP